jgi:hypothetical protein
MRCLGAAIILAVLVPRVAHAGNDDAVLLGNQAMLTGGAVTAIVSDGAGAWFNPAGIAHATRNQLDVNGSVYGLNVYNVKSLLVLPDGSAADAKVTDWILVPSVLSFTRDLSDDMVVSFGLFVPRTNDFELRTGLTNSLDQSFAATVTTILNEYDYSLALAKRFGPKLRLGATLAGVYVSRRDFVQVAEGTPGAVNEGFYSGSSSTTAADYGVRLTLGVQWEPTPDMVLGVSIQSPIFTGWSDVARTEVQGTATPAAPSTGFVLDGQDGAVGVWDFTTPARLRVGLAYQLGDTALLLDGDVSTPVTVPDQLPDTTFYDRDWVGNVRLGLLQAIAPGVTAGGGLFTDLSGRKQFKTQFVGVAFGAKFESQHTADEKRRELTFTTTLGGRYAYGWGDLRGVQLALDGAELTQQAVASPVKVHELGLNFGAGVNF